MRAVATATVKAPIDHVWEVLADHEGIASWAPGLRVTLRPGSAERNGIGAVREIHARGPAPTIVEEIVGFEPPRRLAYKALSGVPLRNYGGEVTLEPSATGTRISYAITADRRSPLDTVATHAIARLLLTALVRRVKATV